MKRYSEMTLAELQMEMERLRREAETLRKRGDMVTLGILEQKYFLAKSYYLGTKPFQIGRRYRVYGHDVPFEIEYFNGVFAWGRFQGSTEQTGFPVGMLDTETPPF
ncbi:MAG: YfhH family protein [Brevibacillus sp.]|nr:YfhH family protein [Brevibacillus sp.]